MDTQLEDALADALVITQVAELDAVDAQKSWDGVAILTRTETVRAVHGVVRGLPGAAEQGARLIAAELEVAGWGGLHLGW